MRLRHFAAPVACLALCACHGSATPPTRTVERVGAPAKIFQLLGDEDKEFTPPQVVPSQTLSRYGIAGADCGYPIAFGGKTFFLLADVVGTDAGVTNLFADAVGWTTSLSSAPFAIDFFPSTGANYAPTGASLGFTPLTVNGYILGANDGPASAFTDGVKLYGLFGVGHEPTAIDPVTGEPAGGETGFVAVSRGDGTFTAMFDLPAPLVWTQTAVVPTSSLPGVPWTSSRTLLVWGHNAGAPVLAAAPLENVSAPGWLASWRWWSGSVWVGSAPSAAFVFPADGCGGNFSVSFVAGMNKWLMTERCPGSQSTLISFRTADSPLGPWSPAQSWFDPVADDGFCHFVHEACPDAGPCCDEDITSYPPFGNMVPGHAYAPFVLPQLGTWDEAASTATVYSLLSTGNPYTPVLMQTHVHSAM